jgi:hypothetical protein
MTEHLRAAIAAALEALDSGDQREASSILLGTLEDAPDSAGVTCEGCGRRFDWPGLLHEHELRCTELSEVAA